MRSYERRSWPKSASRLSVLPSYSRTGNTRHGCPPAPRPPNSRGWRVIGCSPGVLPPAKSPSVSSSTNFFKLSLAPSDRQLVCGIRSPSGNSWRPSSWRILPNTGMLGSECRHSIGGWSRSDARRRAPYGQ